ncbi:uncharacterized protein [Chamaea fasciata]|uniref:uncharacterized protein isoform X3 n=1 Tax=Chamaea fasciata TaxID=190680 RepID=UPI00336AB60C
MILPGTEGPCFDNDRQMEKNITTVMCQLNWGTKMCISSNAILTVMGKKLSSWLDSMKGSCGRSTEAADAWRIQSGNGGAVEMLSSDAVSTFCCLSLPTYYCQDGCVVAGGEVKEPCPQTQIVQSNSPAVLMQADSMPELCGLAELSRQTGTAELHCPITGRRPQRESDFLKRRPSETLESCQVPGNVPDAETCPVTQQSMERPVSGPPTALPMYTSCP